MALAAALAALAAAGARSAAEHLSVLTDSTLGLAPRKSPLPELASARCPQRTRVLFVQEVIENECTLKPSAAACTLHRSVC